MNKKLKPYNKRIVIIIASILGLLAVIEIVMLLLLAAQNGRYHTYWQKRAETTTNEAGLLYVALGDSVGISIGASSAEKGYVGLIAELLEQKAGRPVRVVNLSKSGATINQAVEDQLPKLKTYDPDVVTIEIGANDMVHTWDEAKFRDDMTRLMSELPKHTVISDMPYFGGGIKRGVEKNVPRANEIIRELAAERGLSVAPLHQITKDNDSLRVYAADYFHPNNRGHQNWFQAFWSVIDER